MSRHTHKGAQLSIKQSKNTSDEASRLLAETDRFIEEKYDQTIKELYRELNETKSKIDTYIGNYKSNSNRSDTLSQELDDHLNHLDSLVRL
jgi:uncharacterized coiled-coil DUF342 family protein